MHAPLSRFTLATPRRRAATACRWSPGRGSRGLAADAGLLPAAVAAVRAAGAHLRDRLSPDARRGGLAEVRAAVAANDAAALAVLRARLEAARPGAGWAGDGHAAGALPPGEWWVTDPVEGDVDHVHGLADWGVTAALVRDNVPVLAAVHLPLSGDTYTAVRGGGAHANGARLRPSARAALDGALVGTGQARPGEPRAVHRRLGRSVTAMLAHALVVRATAPLALQLVEVAAGRLDAVWQYGRTGAGLAAGALAGALLVEEAGGTVSDTRGAPWTRTSADLLAAAPGLHAAALHALAL